MRLFTLLAMIFLYMSSAGAETLTVVTFNVESDDDTLKEQVAKDIETIADAVDLWGLVEVADKDQANAYRAAAAKGGGKYRYILGESGGEDRLTILYNLDRLRLMNTQELDQLPGSRKALVSRFKMKESGREFYFAVNHFNRGDASRRQRQARGFSDWIKKQKLPVIAVGDYNFDYDPKRHIGNRSFEIFSQGRTVKWIQPHCVSEGNCPKTGTQCDPNYSSILDFVFAANGAEFWAIGSEVLYRERDYCARDRRGHSDHRPVRAI